MIRALRGSVWLGEGDDALEDHVVLIEDGVIVSIEPFAPGALSGADETLGAPGCWVGPGIFDRHVHLCGMDASELLARGVVAVRDMGEPEGHPAPDADESWPLRAVGEVLTRAPELALSGGPRPDLREPDKAMALSESERAAGVQAIKVGLHDETCGKATTPAALAATVDAAHERALPVIARAQTVEMVERAVVAGVDELANMPSEPLPASLVLAMRERGIAVCSTLQMLFANGLGPDAARNAAALVEAGVPLYYGTDQGNIPGRPGVDPRELDRLAGAGLGRLGALRTAVYAPLRVGEQAHVVALQDDPIREPAAWWAPLVTVSGTSVRLGSGAPEARS